MSSRNAARRHRGRNPMIAPPLRAVTAGHSDPRSDPHAAIAHWQTYTDKPLFVYFIQDGEDGPIKIGKAHNPRTRLAELQCGNPSQLTLRAVVLAANDTEQIIHVRCEPARLRGEWYGGGHQHEILRRARNAQAQQIKEAPASTMHPMLRTRALYKITQLPQQMIRTEAAA